MRIYLGGYLTFYAAGQHWVEVHLGAPERLRDVLVRAAIPAGEVFLTALNGVLVDPDQAQVSQSDEVRLYPPVDGGATDGPLTLPSPRASSKVTSPTTVERGERVGVRGDAATTLQPSSQGLALACRVGCGACCIAPSISSPIPGHPQGKPAGVRCLQLTPGNLCRLFSRPERPAVCVSLKPSPDMCGQTAAEAYAALAALERATLPAPPHPTGESHDRI
jgi:hypothetical protein